MKSFEFVQLPRSREAIGAKYKGVNKEPTVVVEDTTWGGKEMAAESIAY
jgi:hypothetical protein